MLHARWLAVAMLVASPSGAAVQAPVNSKPAVHVFYDSSSSMAGYVTDSPDLRPLGDLTVLAGDFAAGQKMPIRNYCFGKAVAPFTGDPTVWGTKAAFKKPPVAACGNQESHIDFALAAISKLPPSNLAILVSDFWLDAKAMASGPQVAVGLPIRAILADRSVMLIGLRVPFSGPISPFPGVGKHVTAKERVLIIMVAGPADKVVSFTNALASSGSKSFANMKRTLFRLPVTASLPQPIASGPGVEKHAKGFEFEWSEADRAGSKGTIRSVYNLEKLPLAGISVWRGNVVTGTSVQKRTPAGWQTYPLSGPTWKVQPVGHSAVFAFGTHLVRMPEGDYRLTASIGTDGKLPATGDPAAAWMREWDLPAAPGTPAFVKAKGLADLAAMMEKTVAKQHPLGRFTTDIRIEN